MGWSVTELRHSESFLVNLFRGEMLDLLRAARFQDVKWGIPAFTIPLPIHGPLVAVNCLLTWKTFVLACVILLDMFSSVPIIKHEFNYLS
jgi:hypothetical protein